MSISDAQSILDDFRIIVKSLREASKDSEKKVGISTAQLFVLQKISESPSPLSINDLATRTLTHQSSVSVVVKKLLKARLVERGVSKNDARITEVHLSAKGQTLLKKSPPLIQQRLIDGIEKLPATNRKNLKDGLKMLIEKAGLQENEPSLFFEESRSRKKNG